MKNAEKDTSKKLVFMGVGLFAAIAVAGALCLVLMLSGNSKPSENVGLKNPELMGAPDAITSKDLEEEYQSREQITLEMQETIDETVLRLASYGNFSELDSFLAKKQATFKNAEGDENQAVEDWRGKFELLRADIATTVNMSEANAPISWVSYTTPAILAAAIAYSPISLKADAFIDWSSVMFPAVSPADASGVNLQAAEIENPSEMLADINKNSEEQFYGLSAYDMTLFGYRCRLYAVADIYGYYRPYSLVGIDGHLIDPPTRQTVQEIKRALTPHMTLDDVISVTPFNQEEHDALVAQHPEWFDENGAYIQGDAVGEHTRTEATPVEREEPSAEVEGAPMDTLADTAPVE